MSFTQTSISQRRGRETARPRAGLASDLAATASLVAAAARPTWDASAPKRQRRYSSGRADG
jgi:hypothetical protein